METGPYYELRVISPPRKYQYQRLRQANDIRLLNLHPATSDIETITCSLHITSLESAPDYDAVSYTWGDASKREDLLCDGAELSVTKNLADALRRMRRTHSVLLWADAACIDQADLDERSQQVSLMRNIYTTANRVLVWLGPGAPGSGFALDFLERLAVLQCQFLDSPPPDICTDAQLDDLLREGVESVRFVQTFAAVDLPQRLLIGDFFSRPWFRRVWVIQEVTRGTAVTLMCGQRTMNWKAFSLAAKVLSHCSHEQQLWPNGQLQHVANIGLRHIASTLSRVSWLEELSLTELMYYAANYDATDPRDKIYALLGCSTKAMVYNYPVDYHRSLIEVSGHIAPLLYLDSCSIDPLHFAQYEHEIPRGLPSWTPSYDAMRTVFNLGYTSKHENSADQIYGVEGAHFEVDAHELRVSGALLDSVSDVSGLASSRLPEHELWQWDTETLKSVMQIFVFPLPGLDQPAAFRSFVESCFLGHSVNPGNELLQTDEQRDVHGRLLLALIFYYSPTNAPPSAPSYLGIPPSSVWRDRMMRPSEAEELRTIYETYNLEEQYDPTAQTQEAEDLRLDTVLNHYAIRADFDETALHMASYRVGNACIRRRFFRLLGDQTTIGIGPGVVRPGDVVVQLLGSRSPFILRPEGGHYLCVGECFIAGRMPGDPLGSLEGGSSRFVIK